MSINRGLQWYCRLPTAGCKCGWDGLWGIPEGTRLHFRQRRKLKFGLASPFQRLTAIRLKNKNRRKPTFYTGCIFLLWTLPRAKNCSPTLNFYTSVRTGVALSSPFLQKYGVGICLPHILVHRKGLEPPTLGTGIRCSIH